MLALGSLLPNIEGFIVFVELDTRQADGLTISLEWDGDTETTQVVVRGLHAASQVGGSARPDSHSRLPSGDNGMSAVAVMRKPVTRGWVVAPTDGREVARFTGPGTRWSESRYSDREGSLDAR